MKSLNLLIVCLFVCACLSVPPPLWVPRFTQSFTQGDYQAKVYTSGKIWYDYQNNRQRCDVNNDYYDLLCSSVSQSGNSSCSQVIQNDKLYIMLPEQKKCCMCCTAAQGCRITQRDWLKDFQYIGIKSISWDFFYAWTHYDTPSNITYLGTIEDQPIPRRLSQGTYSVDFMEGSYTEDQIPESVFSLPSQCERECPKTSYCANFRKGNGENQYRNMFMRPNVSIKGLRISQE